MIPIIGLIGWVALAVALPISAVISGAVVIAVGACLYAIRYVVQG